MFECLMFNFLAMMRQGEDSQPWRSCWLQHTFFRGTKKAVAANRRYGKGEASLA